MYTFVYAIQINTKICRGNKIKPGVLYTLITFDLKKHHQGI